MSYQLLLGDCLETMRGLPSGSVQTCVTSPPYYGLRDYQTASWEGGDPECDHVEIRGTTRGGPNSTLTGGQDLTPHKTQYRDLCGKCGARRIDNQIGLEETPDAYVAKLVDVFREVRRVLRDDGTLWLNLGSSYASSDTRSNQSRPLTHVPAYGNDGKESQDSLDADHACRDSYGAQTGEILSRHDRSARNDQSVLPDVPQTLPTDHDNGHLDSGQASLGSLQRGAQASTILESSLQLPGVSSQPWMALADPLESDSYARGVQESAHKEQNIPGKSLTSQTLDDRNSDKALLDSASSSPGDSAALTYLYSTIASLNFQSKQLIPIPWLVALALQADGWILRSDIIWHKLNCMPESCRDRPTKAHEYIFLLSKASSYYYDADAVREPLSPTASYGGTYRTVTKMDDSRNDKGTFNAIGKTILPDPNGRNRRSVWTVPTKSYSEAHFATFPPDLIEPCILAGTSAHGCCAKCGAPWERVTERDRPSSWEIRKMLNDKNQPGVLRNDKKKDLPAALRDESKSGFGIKHTSTTGWQPTCTCNAEAVPCTVLDPFAGSGTTLAVALKHGRRGIGCELNPDYIELAHRRIQQSQPMLFAMEPTP